MGGGRQLRRAFYPEIMSQNGLAAARSSKNARKLRADAGPLPPSLQLLASLQPPFSIVNLKGL